MPSNEILEEIRQARDEHARRFNDDLEAIFKDLRKQQQAGNRRVVSFIDTSLEPMPDEALQPASAERTTAEMHP